jgi:hypothetical protein
MKSMLITTILLFICFYSFAQKVDSVKIEYDKDGGQGVKIYTSKGHSNNNLDYTKVKNELDLFIKKHPLAESDDSLLLVINTINENIKK